MGKKSPRKIPPGVCKYDKETKRYEFFWPKSNPRRSIGVFDSEKSGRFAYNEYCFQKKKPSEVLRGSWMAYVDQWPNGSDERKERYKMVRDHFAPAAKKYKKVGFHARKCKYEAKPLLTHEDGKRKPKTSTWDTAKEAAVAVDSFSTYVEPQDIPLHFEYPDGIVPVIEFKFDEQKRINACARGKTKKRKQSDDDEKPRKKPKKVTPKSEAEAKVEKKAELKKMKSKGKKKKKKAAKKVPPPKKKPQKKVLSPKKKKQSPKRRLANFYSDSDSDSESDLIILKRDPAKHDSEDEPIINSSSEQMWVTDSEGEKKYRVDKVLKERGKGKKREYFVSWFGYTDSENTWEPESNVKGTEALEKYIKEKKQAKVVIDSDGEEKFRVERVLKERGKGRKKEYYVSWVGYSESENTWEPKANVEHTDAFAKYVREKGPQKKKRALVKREAIDLTVKREAVDLSVKIEQNLGEVIAQILENDSDEWTHMDKIQKSVRTHSSKSYNKSAILNELTRMTANKLIKRNSKNLCFKLTRAGKKALLRGKPQINEQMDFWVCKACTLRNDMDRACCEACETIKPRRRVQKNQGKNVQKKEQKLSEPQIVKSKHGRSLVMKGGCVLLRGDICVHCPPGMVAFEKTGFIYCAYDGGVKEHGAHWKCLGLKSKPKGDWFCDVHKDPNNENMVQMQKAPELKPFERKRKREGSDSAPAPKKKPKKPKFGSKKAKKKPKPVPTKKKKPKPKMPALKRENSQLKQENSKLIEAKQKKEQEADSLKEEFQAHKDETEQEFQCPICIGLMVEARVLACGHHGCGKCLDQWLQTKRTCPAGCGSRVEAPYPCKPVPLVRSMLQMLIRRLSGEELKEYRAREKEHREYQSSRILNHNRFSQAFF